MLAASSFADIMPKAYFFELNIYMSFQRILNFT